MLIATTEFQKNILMKNLALTLVSLFTVCLSTEVTAQNQPKKVTTVTKTSIKQQNNKEELSIDEDRKSVV